MQTKQPYVETYLATTCRKSGTCRGNCGDSVRQAPTGNWYITIGHPGFYTETNSTIGYSSARRAIRALAMRNVKGKL